MTTYSRADWGARPARSGPGPLAARDVVGLVFHWPAMSKPLRGFAAVSAALRSWQDYHMGKGWSDIAYPVAVDQDGNRYILRGLDPQRSEERRVGKGCVSTCSYRWLPEYYK